MDKSFEIVETPFGNFLINEYDLIGNFINTHKYWEYHLYHFYAQLLTPESYCIDAGANLGFHTIQFGRLSKKVYAFEPQSLIFNQLCANILFNGLDEVINPYKLALGDKIEEKQLWNIEHEDWVGNGAYNWGGRGIIQDNYGGEKRSSENEFREYDVVKVIPLDSLNIPKCDLLKIDIQGYEYFTFLGAQNLLQSEKPVILLENPISEDDCDIKSKIHLKELGYEIYRYGIGNKDDCIVIHPESKNYLKAKEIINSLNKKYNIKLDQ
jgi:FkbM family methyltransferase